MKLSKFHKPQPEGGVKRGELFSVNHPKEFLNSSVIPPKGRWRYGLFDCFNETERFTPMCILSTVALIISMGQIMTRLRTWLGERVDIEEFDKTGPCTNHVDLVSLICGLPYFGCGNLNPLVCVLTAIKIVKTRRAIRKQYEIPPYIESCDKAEHFVVAIFCQPCAACQLSAHTADFDTYPSVCCSRTGYPKDAPVAI